MSLLRPLAAALLVTACGPGVHDLSLPAAPFGEVTAQVDLAGLPADAKVLASLAWLGVNDPQPVCLAFAAGLGASCRDPLAVVVQRFDAAVPVAADGRFTLPLAHLPSAEVLVGNARSRLAAATVVVGLDGDGDGRLLPVVFGGPEGPRDRIVAASFANLLTAHTQLSFREGPWDEALLGLFSPATGCEPWRPGFSVLASSGYVLPPATPGPCRVLGLETVVDVPRLSDHDAVAFECPLPQVEVVAPPDEPPGDPATMTCLDPKTAVMFVGPETPVVDPRCGATAIVLPLAGCSSFPACTAPVWDRTASPPAWWPCR